jgi:hypothetical protein
MKTILKIISTGILVLMLVTIFVPVGYLAWRADQPMALPQFKGYTYYQYLSWRKDALHQMAAAYRAAYPRAKMGGGLDACYDVDATGYIFLILPQAGFYTLAGAYPNLENYVTPPDRQYIPRGVTLKTFLPDWWKTYEQGIWYVASTAVEDPVSYCRLAATPPAQASLDP